MQGDSTIRPDAPGFSQAQVATCIQKERLLTLAIALPDSTRPQQDDDTHADLTLDEIQLLLTQAAQAGCQTVTFLDHPTAPSPYRDTIIDHALQQNLNVEWFTQGKGVNAQIAQSLYQRGVAVALRIDCLNELLQNTLAQNNQIQNHQAYTTIHRALACLKQAGYGKPTSNAPIIAADISICPANFSQLPELWRWLRKQQIQPWLQVISPDRLAAHSPYLLNPASVQAMFQQLRELDQTEFDCTWAIPANTSVRANGRLLWSCHVNHDGSVIPCAGLALTIGHVRQNTIGDILEQSEILENIRQYPTKLKTPCREHVQQPEQLCCRSTAWQLTGDYLGADPLCPHTQGCELTRLPTSIVGLIPHGPSMRAIDTLVDIIERYSTTQWTIPADSPLIDPQGKLDGTAYIECIAQSFAASHGFHLSPEDRKHHRGLLLGVKNYKLHNVARAGDTITIQTHRFGRFANFGIVHGKVYHADGRMIAEGEVKIWRPPNDDEQEASPTAH